MDFEYRHLGKSGPRISPIGLGVMQFAGGRGMFRAMFPAVPEETRIKIIKTALDGGINWFDTAELYGGGQSERYLSEALQEIGARPSDVFVATKWSPFLRFAGNIPRTIQARVANLAPYPIGLHQIHNPASFSSVEAQMNAMADLVEEGKIGHIGVSNFSAEGMRRSQAVLEKRGLRLASNQVQYHLLHRKIEGNGVLETARELGVTIIAWSPLASGLLTGKFHRDPEFLARTPSIRRRRLESQLERSRPVVEELERIAERLGAEPAQVALSWLISQGEEVVAIPGASRVGHVLESLGAMGTVLSAEDLDRLDQVSRKSVA